MTTHGSIHSCEVGARWLGRILGVLLAGLVVLIALGEGVPNVLNLPGPVQLQFMAMALVMGGLILGWRWEMAGGLIALAGFGVFCAVELLANGTLPAGALLLFCLPPLLLLVSRWLASRFHPNKLE